MDEIAEIFQVPLDAVSRWLASGELQAVRIGIVTRVRREDLDDFIQSHLTTTTKAGDK